MDMLARVGPRDTRGSSLFARAMVLLWIGLASGLRGWMVRRRGILIVGRTWAGGIERGVEESGM